MAEPSSQSSPFQPSNGVRLFGRYTLLGKLGTGGQGEVWRARDRLGAEIALKILRSAYRGSDRAWVALEHEHAIASRLDHPRILKVFPPEHDAAVAALPMELAAGGDLRRLRGASYLEIVPVLMEVAQALAYAHDRSIVHRDLKPGNVLLDARGHVKLSDFGIAGMVLEEGGSPERPVAGISPFTASPEQLRGEPPCPEDDIYGLGALAYELLSGYPPYYPRFELARVLAGPIPPLKSVHRAPDQLLELVLAMLATRRVERPRSMREVGEMLEWTLNDTLSLDPDETIETAAFPSSATPTVPVDVARRATPPIERVQNREPSRIKRPAAGSAPPRAATTAAPIPAAERREPVDANAAPPAPSPPQRSAPAPEWPLGSHPLDGDQTVELSTAALIQRTPIKADPAMEAAAPRPEPTLSPLLAELRVEQAPSLMRLEPLRRSRRPWITLAVMALAVLAGYLWLPSWAPQLTFWTPPALEWPSWLAPSRVLGLLRKTDDGSGQPPSAQRGEVSNPPQPQTPALDAPSNVAASGALAPVATARPLGARPSSASSAARQAPPSASAPAPEPARLDDGSPVRERRLRMHVRQLDARLASLAARGAAAWASADYAAAQASLHAARQAMSSNDSRGAEPLAAQASHRIDDLEQFAARRKASELAAGEQALAAGDGAAARAAFEAADELDPGDPQTAEGLRSVRALGGAATLLADAVQAEAEQQFARAVQDYAQTLSLDPVNEQARAGLTRASDALGTSAEGKWLGAGFAALGAGQLEDARQAFTQAQRIDPNGTAVAEGLARVAAALRVRGFAELRTRAAALEAQDRFGEALETYDAALRLDPSLSFALQGRARAEVRAQLISRLHALLDDPHRLESAATREQAGHLIEEAKADPPGPVVSSLVSRLELVLPQFEKPVHLDLISDDATEVQISDVGSFGMFSRREIDLKPGRYTVIGTRAGYRDVRQELTVAPGQDGVTINVTCTDPI